MNTNDFLKVKNVVTKTKLLCKTTMHTWYIQRDSPHCNNCVADVNRFISEVGHIVKSLWGGIWLEINVHPLTLKKSSSLQVKKSIWLFQLLNHPWYFCLDGIICPISARRVCILEPWLQNKVLVGFITCSALSQFFFIICSWRLRVKPSFFFYKPRSGLFRSLQINL